MEIKCPQHKVPLEIEECEIEILEMAYPSTVGVCPSCQICYINRMLFQKSSHFQINKQSYQYHDGLHVAYPPKEPKPVEKKEQSAEAVVEKHEMQKNMEPDRKKKARADGIKEIRDRIMSGKYQEYHAKNVYSVKRIPKCCIQDSEELLMVEKASFDMFGRIVRMPAYCCIRCASAYILDSQKKELNPKGQKGKTQKSDSVKKTLLIDFPLQRIPYLQKNDSWCPFCANVLDTTIDVQFYSFNYVGRSGPHHTALKGCRQCQAVFATTETLDRVKKNYFGHTVHTILPDAYPSAVEMMQATKQLPHQEEASKMPLPYEEIGDSVENISRESKVVQVYANKCHCQKCENKYNRVTTVNRTAVVDTLDGSTADINVMFCKGCGQYFVSIVTLAQYRTIYGGLLMECKVSHDLVPSQYAWFDFASDSILSRCGYTVKEGVSREYRQAILRYILETGKATKYEIIEKINSFISFRENQKKYDGACQRWREDIKYVNEYMIHKQKKVYGLEFKTAKKH